MCGIVYAHNIDKNQPVNNDILQLFDKQRSRGVQGFGLFDGQDLNIVRETKEDSILKWLVKYDSNMILFHHRMPTSTDNVKRAAHPFSTHKFFGKYQYILVHNGHITNSKELKTEHEKLGIKYKSITHDGRFNDSEALLWDLALVIEGKKEKLKAAGGIAFICVRLKNGKLDRMYFGRNYNPLTMTMDDKHVRISSAGSGEMVKRDKLFTYNYKTKKLFDVDFTIPHSTYTTVPLSGGTYKRQPDYSNWNWQNSSYKHFTNHDKGRKGTPGDWLPKAIQERYGHLIGRGVGSGEGRSDFLDYDKNGNPVYDSYDQYYEDYWKSKEPLNGSVLTEDEREYTENMTPQMEKVYSLVFHYMSEANGNFEQAYFLAEGDYELLFDVPEEDKTMEFLQGVVNIEQVLEEINSDPDYEDENSVSNSWLPLNQQLLLPA